MDNGVRRSSNGPLSAHSTEHGIENLTHRQVLQRLGLNLRDEIVRKLSSGAPSETVVSTIALRGDPALAEEIVQTAIKLEEMTGEAHPLLLKILGMLERKAKAGDVSRVHKPESEELADMIFRRLLEGKPPRESDIDLTDGEAHLVLEKLADHPKELAIFKLVLHERAAYKTALQRTALDLERANRNNDLDLKFPSILNGKALLRLVDTKEKNSTGSFVFFDVNGFKKLNDDELGYTFVDDVVLRVICQTLADHFGTNAIARFGGDEFMVYLPNEQDPNVALRDVAQAFAMAAQSVTAQDVKENWAILKQTKQEDPPATDEEKRDDSIRRARIVNSVVQMVHDLHAKMGATKRQTGEAGIILRHRSEGIMQQAAIAAKIRPDLRFPAKCEIDGKIMSAIASEQAP